MARLSGKQITVVFALFLIAIPLVYEIWAREMGWTVAAYHVFDVPPEMVGWFVFFFWASWSVPALWLIALLLLIIETVRKRRRAAFIMCASLPFAGAALFWVGWQAFLIYYGHATA